MGLYKALGENPKAKEVWKNLSSDKRRDYADFIDNTVTKDTKALKIKKVISILEKIK